MIRSGDEWVIEYAVEDGRDMFEFNAEGRKGFENWVDRANVRAFSTVREGDMMTDREHRSPFHVANPFEQVYLGWCYLAKLGRDSLNLSVKVQIVLISRARNMYQVRSCDSSALESLYQTTPS